MSDTTTLLDPAAADTGSAAVAPPGESRDAVRPRLTTLATPPKVRDGGAMPLAETVASAIRSLRANTTRSLLTMLGIIIGVGAVVGLLAVGNGVSGFVRNQIEGNGANTVTVQGAKAVANGVPTGGRYQSLTLEDAQALAEPGVVPHAVAVSPEVQTQTTIAAGNATAYGAVVGAWPDYLTARHQKIADGDFITDADVASGARVVVLGPTLARDLFGAADPIGQSVRVGGVSLRVVGVLAPKSGGPPGAGFLSPDSQAYVPLPTALSALVGNSGVPDPKAGVSVRRGQVIATIAVEAQQGHVGDATAEVRTILDARHGAGGDYEMTSNEALLGTVTTTITLIQLFLVFVAGISLLVGGIGIMNIMLVSVTERTREIGIRKAIGAKEGDILLQFLVESVVISLIGAAFGVIAGLALAGLATLVWRPCPVSATGIAVSVLVAMATGLFFGIYPARRAAHLKPIDALRYE